MFYETVGKGAVLIIGGIIVWVFGYVDGLNDTLRIGNKETD